MILYVNGENEIKDVNETNNVSLLPIEVDENVYPFNEWTIAKLCCYKIKVNDKNIIMSPYVPWVVVEQIDRQGKENINLQAQVDYISMMTDIEL